MSGQKVHELSQYLTVKQFATKVERSQQSIYKKMTYPEFQRYVIEYNGKKMIHVSAITDLYTKHDEPETPKAADTDHIEVPSRDDFIEFLKRQIEEKDRQIASLNEALKNEQLLRASADRRIALLETRQPQDLEEPEEPEKQTQEETQEVSSNTVDVIRSETSVSQAETSTTSFIKKFLEKIFR